MTEACGREQYLDWRKFTTGEKSFDPCLQCLRWLTWVDNVYNARAVTQSLLTHSYTMTPLTGLGKKPFENIVGKGEIACTSNFSFSHSVFYSITDRNYHFCYI